MIKQLFIPSDTECGGVVNEQLEAIARVLDLESVVMDTVIESTISCESEFFFIIFIKKIFFL